MGPEATVDFYREIIRLTPAEKDQDHIPVLIYSNPKIPDRTCAIVEGGEDPLPALIESARILEEAGAGILTIPCNAAHYYIPEIQRSVRIPCLNMIEEACRAARVSNPAIRVLGLLAATGTIRCGIYQTACAREGLDLMVPEDQEQRLIHSVIGQVKAGRYGETTRGMFERIGAELINRGAGAIVLGCTEIPLAFDCSKVNYHSLNPTRILAQVAVNWALRRRDSA
jgi:aspartate racemase